MRLVLMIVALLAGVAPVSAQTYLELPPRSAVSGAPGSVAWSNPTNALTADSTGATSVLTTAGQMTQRLKLSNFGFTVPSSATVTGFEVTVVARYTGAGTANFQSIVLVTGTGTVLGTVYGSGTSLGGSWSSVTFGSSTDDWGLAAGGFGPDDVNDAGFTVGVRAVQATGTPQCEIDSVLLRVWYTGGLSPVLAPAGLRFFWSGGTGGFHDVAYTHVRWKCTYYQPVAVQGTGTNCHFIPSGAALTGAAAEAAVPSFYYSGKPGQTFLGSGGSSPGAIQIYPVGSTQTDAQAWQLKMCYDFNSSRMTLSGSTLTTTPFAAQVSLAGPTFLGADMTGSTDGHVVIRADSGFTFDDHSGSGLWTCTNLSVGSRFEWIKFDMENWDLANQPGGSPTDITPLLDAFNREFQDRGQYLESLGVQFQDAFKVDMENLGRPYSSWGKLAQAIAQVRDEIVGYEGHDGLYADFQDVRSKLATIESNTAGGGTTPDGPTAPEWPDGPTQDDYNDKLDSQTLFTKGGSLAGWLGPQGYHSEDYSPNPDGGVNGGFSEGPIPPPWTFSVDMGHWSSFFGGPSAGGTLALSIDWTPIAPYAYLFRALFTGWALMSCIAMVWEEFRRY